MFSQLGFVFGPVEAHSWGPYAFPDAAVSRSVPGPGGYSFRKFSIRSMFPGGEEGVFFEIVNDPICTGVFIPRTRFATWPDR